MSSTLYAGKHDDDRQAAVWEAKAVLGINIVFSVICLVLLHIMVRILEQGSDYRKPYIALILSISFSLLNHILLVLLWNISDPIDYALPRLRMICAADAISWLAEVCMLAAVILILWNRQQMHASVGRGFGVLKKGLDIALLTTLLVIGAMVLPAIAGTTFGKAKYKSLTSEEYSGWQSTVRILHGRVNLTLFLAVVIDIPATTFILRSRIRRLGHDDKPTNAVALRLVPLLIARCAYEMFAEFFWFGVTSDFAAKEYHSIDEAEVYIRKLRMLYLARALERSITLGAIYVVLIIVGRTAHVWSSQDNVVKSGQRLSYETAMTPLRAHRHSRSSDSLNSLERA
ncbi:hypothetical protein BKA62DRAFT_708973 [Auriculariales sp. MPI-PUGE-AT-0066]|nr:hypothetical protein BKA62DRAFT_708973 [Auriculariales sp. MPI-PUGE-AT-0066]